MKNPKYKLRNINQIDSDYLESIEEELTIYNNKLKYKHFKEIRYDRGRAIITSEGSEYRNEYD